MVPARTMNPEWSPDSKWIAYVRHLNSLYKQIVAVNVETGESKPVTDGLSDASWPAWDASGKYLWFLASTDFGLKSQWLDMTNYPIDETFRALLRDPLEVGFDAADAGERRRDGRARCWRRSRCEGWRRAG